MRPRPTLFVPRHLANIGRRHRILGNLDSCRIYLEEAERWIRAYPDLSNRARFPLIQAEYYAQVGDFVAVDSLHALAAELTPAFSTIDKLAELHLQLIRQGTERGRPAQVYRSIAFLESRRDQLRDAFADRNEIFDLDLAIADFLGRQGVFDELLDRALRPTGILLVVPDDELEPSPVHAAGRVPLLDGELDGVAPYDAQVRHASGGAAYEADEDRLGWRTAQPHGSCEYAETEPSRDPREQTERSDRGKRIVLLRLEGHLASLRVD